MISVTDLRSGDKLTGVTLQVAAGEAVAIVGSRGSGKSTLIRILAGQLAPDGGTASVQGVPVSDPACRRLVGVGDAGMIELNGLTNRYGTVTALDSLTLSIKQGETLGLLGPNGAGKTTTLRLLAGLAEPTVGQVAATCPSSRISC